MEYISQVLILGNLLLNSFHNLLRLFSGNSMTGTFLNMLCYLCGNKLRCRFYKRISGIGALYIGVGICIMEILVIVRFNFQLCICYLLRLDFLHLNNISGFEDRIAFLCFLQNIIKFIVCSQHNSVYIFIPGTLSIRQTQTTAYHLFTQNFGCSSTQRNDGIKVIYIPALFEHIDVNNDFYRIIGTFHVKQ